MSEVPETPENPAPKRIQNLAKRVLAGGEISRASIEKIGKVLKDKKSEDAQAFLKLLRDKSDKTEEELLAELQALTPAPPSAHKRGQIDQRTMEKIHLAWRLQQRGLTYDQIAETMKVSWQRVGQYLRQAKDLLKIDPTTINLPDQVGQTLALYEDVRQMALTIASSQKSSNTQKLQAMQVVLSLERDKTDFLTKVGVYSPSVIDTFKALVLQQVTHLHGPPSQEKPQESPVDLFFHGLAKELAQASFQRRNASQLEAKDAEFVEVVERPEESRG